MAHEFRAALRAALEHAGLTVPTVTTLVERAAIARCRPGQPIAGPDPTHVIGFVADGVVKVEGEGRHGAPVTLRFVSRGRFTHLAWTSTLRPEPRTRAIAHTAAVVATWPTMVLTETAGAMPSGHLLGLLAHEWQALVQQLHTTCRLLTLSLPERVLHCLDGLADDFGRPHSDGVLVDLPLTHTDLARLVAGTRANVTRSVARLRHAGRLGMVGRRFVLRRPE